jgi:hypothetical protein
MSYIQIKKPNINYFSGDHLYYELDLYLENNTPLQNLEVELMGLEISNEIYIFFQKNSILFFNSKEFKPKSYFKDIFIKKDSDDQIWNGHHTFNSSIQFPKTLPMTFKSELYQIKYILKAKAIIQNKKGTKLIDITKEMEIILCGVGIELKRYRYLSSPILKFVKNSNIFKNNTFYYELGLNSQIFETNSPVEASIKIESYCFAPIIKWKLKLIKQIKSNINIYSYYINSNVEFSFKEYLNIFENKKIINKMIKFNLKNQLPDSLVKSIINEKLIGKYIFNIFNYI